MIQKLGGWQHLTLTPLTGTGRGSHAWADLASNPYLAVGTEQRLEIFQNGSIVDITPLRTTTNPAVAFTTTATNKTVQITDSGFGGSVGDWVNLIIPVSVGGIVLFGFYQIQTVVDTNNYTITAATPATSPVSSGGAVPTFTTVNTMSTVTVTLANHGMLAGAQFAVQVATTVGGITIAVGSYTVTAPVTTNTFVISPGGTATSGATGGENGGDARINYLIPSGLVSAQAVSGYGIGPYGAGPYGVGGSSTVISPLRQWLLDNYGQVLVGNYTNGPIFAWTPPNDVPALQINGTNFAGVADQPTIATASFVSNPAQIFVVLGTDTLGNGIQDPNLISWSDVGGALDASWLASPSNQAGSFRIPSGSRIVGGLIGQLYAYIWTDVDMWLMQYIGSPLVFGFNKIASGCDLMAARCAGIYESSVYWCTRNQFMVFDGNSVQILQCPVWDFFFRNLNRQQEDKVHCAVNSLFGEITWHFPSNLPSNTNMECDSSVTFNAIEKCWTCSGAANNVNNPTFGFQPYTRTTWVDDNPLGPPIGVDQNGLLQQHETSPDADGAPMMESMHSGWTSIAQGNFFTFMERVIPDFVMTTTASTPPSVQYQLHFQDYPSDNYLTKGPYTYSAQLGGPGPEYQIVRGRGRSCALDILGSPLGTWWRIGAFKYLGAPAGRR